VAIFAAREIHECAPDITIIIIIVRVLSLLKRLFVCALLDKSVKLGAWLFFITKVTLP